MIIQPKIRGFICTTAHPVGCARHVQEQIDYVKKHPPIKNGAKKVLVLGASNGYGLASRIVIAFGCGAGTIGVFFEKPPEDKRTATAGWYNSVAFDKAAHKAGLYAKSFNGDAFSDEMKAQVAETIRKDLGQVDMVVYSLASPRRTHPKTGQLSKSVLKPIGASYTNKSLDLNTYQIETVSLPVATQEEVDQTVAVMGGEDWEMWIDILERNNLLAKGCLTVAYSYIGPEITTPIYRRGTIGAAKDHLEATAKKLNERLKKMNGSAFISVNKALVTQSSSAIPFIPLYFVLLSKVMREKGLDENCVGQMYRLFAQCFFAGPPIPIDKEGRIRVDDREMRQDVQDEVQRRWAKITAENLNEFADLKGFEVDFMKLFGFGFSDVDYNADVEHNLPLA